MVGLRSSFSFRVLGLELSRGLGAGAWGLGP